MIETAIRTVFGDPDTKLIKKYTKDLKKIRDLQASFSDMTLEDIQARTAEIMSQAPEVDFETPEGSESTKAFIESYKHEAGALWARTCELLVGQTFTLSDGREITWNMQPYDVQIIGGLAIHDGNIAEMKTGEGKTLVATYPAYLNALSTNSVHIVTVNDYLAQRDAEEMGILYRALGMEAGVIHHSQNKETKRENYQKNVVYATNNELGFDYLRDNMVTEKNNKVMSPKFFAIIDEVDSILIDEARTPLIISMPDNEPTEKYISFATLAKKLQKGTDYSVDEKQKTATLTEAGIEKIEKLLNVENIYVSDRYNDLHHIENAIKAESAYIKDKDYIISPEGEVLIVDEHTGRTLPGRRYSGGLHQAIEAKEGLKIEQESKTLASITFQNFFRMYWKLAGMTGTAKTEEEEFYKVYGLNTVIIPTNKPIAREDRSDLLFKNEKGKFEYVVSAIEEFHKSGQPILVGTVSVEKSEYLSNELKKKNIPHNVLNARRHETEAETIAQAGQKGAVTIATNMAGRGTDIKLGDGVRELGGLIILGTEKHETRRIDNQLRGRAGRQGDPGVTQFLISPNDDIMRIFGGDKLFGVFNSPMFTSLPDNEPLTQSRMLTRKVTGVQKQVEGYNFDARKHVLEYDDVINKHRDIIYTRRDDILSAQENFEDLENTLKDMITNYVRNTVMVEEAKGEKSQAEIATMINSLLGRDVIDDVLEKQDISQIQPDATLADYIADRALDEFEVVKSEIIENTSQEQYQKVIARVMLLSIDRLWMNHIDTMSKLREQVAFIGYAQKQPLMEYKARAFETFDTLMGEISSRTVRATFALKPQTEVTVQRIDDSKLQVQSSDVENMKIGEGISPANGQQPAPANQAGQPYPNPLVRGEGAKGGGNPLFAQPGQAPASSQKTKEKSSKKSSDKKTKIRV